MTLDNPLSRGVIGSLALTLTFGVSLTSVRADVVQPLPRPTAASAGDEARWLERLPPATQLLPRPIDVAQSDTSSLQEALKLLESRVESGAFESAPSTVETDEAPARESTEPVESNEKAEIPVSAPQPPALPVAPEPNEPVPPMEPSPAPSREEASDDASSEDAGRALQKTIPETTAEPVDERIADTPEPIEPTTHTGRWQVQLLAGRSLSRVERDRDDLLRFHGDRVSGLTLTISQASPNGLYRLRALDWPNQAEAGAWCRHLRAATGLKCMVVRGDESPAPGAAPVDTLPFSATR